MKAAEWVYLCVAHPVLGPGGSSGGGGGNGGMSSEVSFGLLGMVFAFWRDVTDVFESLVCRVGRVVRRSIIFCIRKCRQVFSTRQRNYEQVWKKADKLTCDSRCFEKQGGPAYGALEFGAGVSLSVSVSYLPFLAQTAGA